MDLLLQMLLICPELLAPGPLQEHHPVNSAELVQRPQSTDCAAPQPAAPVCTLDLVPYGTRQSTH